MRVLATALFIGCFLLLVSAFRQPENNDPLFTFYENLSGYGFFTGALNNLQPAADVLPYDLNTPLFSNYAEKARFIRLPSGKKAVYHETGLFQLPVGTVLIKNFYYPLDFRQPEKGRRILETRLLAHRESGWATYQYIWNAEQTDAVFEPVGDIVSVLFTDAHGKNVQFRYVIPSQAQCLGCHKTSNRIQPIGMAARHLNGDYAYATGTKNQLQYWKEQGWIDLPEGPHPSNAAWDREASGTVEQRARAYLDINCGHCHSKEGPARTSGLFLDIHETNPTALGILKTPVAAGRGSGNRSYDIEPGKPERSILVYRMHTNDPGIAMPEIGRELVHKEGVALISRWIKEMHMQP
ncbi:MAG TPA: SO2930 family diheme c-type cytochrome [Lacibacter sp.]|nr:SO2930 family diheme c-type cytochrome [Lacibacter sp.]HMO88432.1 SO2930 family diheme c-type cytochrome [Lacibacter sp.]